MTRFDHGSLHDLKVFPESERRGRGRKKNKVYAKTIDGQRMQMLGRCFLCDDEIRACILVQQTVTRYEKK
jgi:hypothetical protein